MSQEKCLRTYTDAPIVYDWGWTTMIADNIGVLVAKNRPIRLVEVEDDYHFQMQTGRYASGLHITLTEEQYQDWIKRGWITPTPEKAVHYLRKVIDFDKAIGNLSKNRRLRPYVTELRKGKKDGISLESIDSTASYRLTVWGPKAEAEEVFNGLVKEIEGILNEPELPEPGLAFKEYIRLQEKRHAFLVAGMSLSDEPLEAIENQLEDLWERLSGPERREAGVQGSQQNRLARNTTEGQTMISRTFEYQKGRSTIRFTVFLDQSEGKPDVTILEPDGSSFVVSSMPLAVWQEVNQWVETCLQGAPQK